MALSVVLAIAMILAVQTVSIGRTGMLAGET